MCACVKKRACLHLSRPNSTTREAAPAGQVSARRLRGTPWRRLTRGYGRPLGELSKADSRRVPRSWPCVASVLHVHVLHHLLHALSNLIGRHVLGQPQLGRVGQGLFHSQMPVERT